MTMHTNIELPSDGSMVDLYLETGVSRGTELRWQNLSNLAVSGYVDDTAPVDKTKFARLMPGERISAKDSQYVVVWAKGGAEIHVESV